MPTLKRLQAKHATAKMMWWQNGKLWNSHHEAQDAMHMRGAKAGGFRDRERKPFRDRGDGPKRTAWTPRGEPSTPAPERDADNKLGWKPKGEFTPAPKRADREERPRSFDREKKPFRSEKPEWKPKFFDRERKPFRSDKREWKPKDSFDRERRSSRPSALGKPTADRQEKNARPSGRLEWKPKGENSAPAPREAKRKWIPKEEYKKAQSSGSPNFAARSPKPAARDKNWRPGGEHKDPRQKYKDAKKAKWTRFKKAIRTRWEAKGKKKSDE